MSEYRYRIDPDTVDLVDDLGYDESDLERMDPETLYEIACRELEPRVRRI